MALYQKVEWYEHREQDARLSEEFSQHFSHASTLRCGVVLTRRGRNWFHRAQPMNRQAVDASGFRIGNTDGVDNCLKVR